MKEKEKRRKKGDKKKLVRERKKDEGKKDEGKDVGKKLQCGNRNRDLLICSRDHYHRATASLHVRTNNSIHVYIAKISILMT